MSLTNANFNRINNQKHIELRHKIIQLKTQTIVLILCKASILYF